MGVALVNLVIAAASQRQRAPGQQYSSARQSAVRHGVAVQSGLLFAFPSRLRTSCRSFDRTSRVNTSTVASTTEEYNPRSVFCSCPLIIHTYNFVSIFTACVLSDFSPTQRMAVLPGNVPFTQLQFPSQPIYKDIFFFNLTNPEGFEKGEKPRVEEIGPYSYT